MLKVVASQSSIPSGTSLAPNVSGSTLSSFVSMVASQLFNTRPESNPTSTLTNQMQALRIQKADAILKKVQKEDERKKELATLKKDIKAEDVDISPSSETFQTISLFLENLSEELQSLEEYPAISEGIREVLEELSLMGWPSNRSLKQTQKCFDGLKGIVNDDWAYKLVQDINSLSLKLDFKKKLALTLQLFYRHVHHCQNGKITVTETPFSQLVDKIRQEIEDCRRASAASALEQKQFASSTPSSLEPSQEDKELATLEKDIEAEDVNISPSSVIVTETPFSQLVDKSHQKIKAIEGLRLQLLATTFF